MPTTSRYERFGVSQLIRYYIGVSSSHEWMSPHCQYYISSYSQYCISADSQYWTSPYTQILDNHIFQYSKIISSQYWIFPYYKYWIITYSRYWIFPYQYWIIKYSCYWESICFISRVGRVGILVGWFVSHDKDEEPMPQMSKIKQSHKKPNLYVWLWG